MIVDVIIPVYRGLEETLRCLNSVLAAPGRSRYELVLVDDASPEPELVAMLDALAARPGVTLLRNPTNQGFVASVNQAMQLHPDRDVVLLNSDTEVANDWLDRLIACAGQQADIGTVTPFSNNATLCSYPRFCADNTLPAGMGLADLDALFAAVNQGRWLELPTAVGFCMYIRRACLDAVGVFDAVSFPRGYGEENDFSRRAVKAGWRNALCADTFVFHAGGVSFGRDRLELMRAAGETLNRLHPEYDSLVTDFVRADTPAHFRQTVDMALARRRMGNEDAPRHGARLHVVHDLGGGLARWCADFCAADTSGHNLVLKPFSTSNASAEGLVLLDSLDESQPLGVWRFERPIHVTDVSHDEYRAVIREIVERHDVGSVLLSSLIGHALDILDTGLPTAQVCHDYFPICPAIQIHFNGVCQSCDETRLRSCASENHDFNPPHWAFPANARLQLRDRYLDLVERNAVTLVVPSLSVRDHLLRLAPRLNSAVFVHIPHGYPVSSLAPVLALPVDPASKLKVMVLGMLSVSKGLNLLLDALPELLSFAELYLVGAQEVGERFVGRPGVNVIDRYTRETLWEHVDAIRPDIGLLPSVVPETFSFTLSELLIMGVPPVATDLGAYAERIRHGDNGFLFDPNPESLLRTLRTLNADRQALSGMRRRLLTQDCRSMADQVAEYARLLPSRATVRPVTREERQWSDVLKAARLRKERDSLALRLEMKSIAQRELHERFEQQGCSLRDLTGRSAAQEIEKAVLAQLLAERDAAIDKLYRSTSWRLSAPVRWLGVGRRRLRHLASLVRRPSDLPVVAMDLWRGWVSGGWAGARAVLVRAVLHVRNRPSQCAPAAIELPPQERDWRQEVFDRYRAAYTPALREATARRIACMIRPPLISILVPTFNTDMGMLRQMFASVRQQWYPHWQLCIVDDGSDQANVVALLRDQAEQDDRINVQLLERNQGVSHASNRALAQAKGDFVVLLDHDDLLEPQALYRVAEAIIADDPDMLYSDEVLVDPDGETVQHFIFRPVFSPEYLRSHPYIVHLVGFRTRLLRDIGGFDESLRISQDYDLILRASERSVRITHIPEILYRWRVHSASAGHGMIDQVTDVSVSVLQRHLGRLGVQGQVRNGPSFNFYETVYPLEPQHLVAIIIPTHNHGGLVKTCIDSLRRTIQAVRYRIVLVDHASDEPESLAVFSQLGEDVQILRYEGPFNFSAINNWAVSALGNDYTHFLLLNNDVEAIEMGWLERMLALGQQPDVGIVGAKLYYPDGHTLQHAGVVVACCGVAENLGRHRMVSEEPLDLGYIGSLIVNREVSAVTAACLLIKRSVFVGIDGFDEAMAVGYGDVDLCLRANASGYRTIFCGQAVLLHHESLTRGRHKEDPHPEDTRRFLTKWRGMFGCGDPYYNPGLAATSPNWQVETYPMVSEKLASRTWVLPKSEIE